MFELNVFFSYLHQLNVDGEFLNELGWLPFFAKFRIREVHIAPAGWSRNSVQAIKLLE